MSNPLRLRRIMVTNSNIFMTKKNIPYNSLAQKVFRAGLLCIILLTAAKAVGQEVRIRNYKAVGAAFHNVQDTYLSPEEYKGAELRYLSHTIREKEGKRWSTTIINEGYATKGESRSENGATLSAAYHFLMARTVRTTLFGDRLRFFAGGQGEITAGVIYNTRNGNNPAQAIANLSVGPAIRMEYPIKRITISYEASCPLLGLTFSPNYGQSYYEIFSEGHYDHNIVPVTLFSTPSLRHAITVEMPIGKTRCVVGIYGDYRQQEVNSLKRHIYSSGILVGIVRNINIGGERR